MTGAPGHGTDDDDRVLGEAVAEAFALGRCRAFTGHQFTVSRTWRLESEHGTFLAKHLWAGRDPFWAPELVGRSELEAAAVAAGVRAPVPVAPTTPAYGFAGRVPGRGVFRVHRWVEGRHPAPDDALEEWAGATAAVLHGLQPADGVVGPRYYGTSAPWSRLAAEASAARLPWAESLRRHVDGLERCGERLRASYAAAGDLVLTHGDLAPRNVLLAASGPTLIDWDSVGEESASHELGDAAYRFGRADPERGRRVVEAYAAAGGRLPTPGADWVVRPIGRRLAELADLVAARTGGAGAGWMGADDLDAQVVARLDLFAVRVTAVDAFAAALNGALGLR